MIKRSTINKIAEKIKNQYKPEKIILFGSYAWGKPTEESDIDLFIIKRTRMRPIDRRIQVRHIVNLRRMIAFSPVVFTPKEMKYLLEIGDPFIKEIMAMGKVLYAK
ncbi:MAG: nucleotidyltransferase domain-containing protein [Thermoplasmata archaeon]